MIMLITDNIDINEDNSFDNEIDNNDSGGDDPDKNDNDDDNFLALTKDVLKWLRLNFLRLKKIFKNLFSSSTCHTLVLTHCLIRVNWRPVLARCEA